MISRRIRRLACRFGFHRWRLRRYHDGYDKICADCGTLGAQFRETSS